MAGTKGMKRTKSHNKKISLALKGKKKSLEHIKKISMKAKKRLKNPLKNPNYRGENVGYMGIHIWLRKNHGNPLNCEQCGKNGSRKTGKWNIVWALKRGFEYKRTKDNFFGLCNKCHRNYDKTKKWNKNVSISRKFMQRNEKGQFKLMELPK